MNCLFWTELNHMNWIADFGRFLLKYSGFTFMIIGKYCAWPEIKRRIKNMIVKIIFICVCVSNKMWVSYF